MQTFKLGTDEMEPILLKAASSPEQLTPEDVDLVMLEAYEQEVLEKFKQWLLLHKLNPETRILVAESTEEKYTILKMDYEASYNKTKPIRQSEDMDKKVETKKMDQEWLENLSDKFWSTNYTGDSSGVSHQVDKLFKLRERLLTFGGEQTCLPVFEDDLDDILDRGQFWYGDRMHIMLGQPNQCHRNTSHLWDVNRNNPNVNVKIATGYALGEDGMWRQHTWLVQVRPQKNRIIETTKQRIGYFGFVMTDDEAESFFWDNH